MDRSAKAVLVIRILVGWVFLSEGIQKFGFPVRSEMDVLRKSSFLGRRSRLLLSEW